MKPTNIEFFKVAKETYQANAPSKIDNFTLIRDTSTFDAYLNEKTKSILIGVRGTKDFEDLKADASLPFNQLTNTLRYQKDKSVLEEIVRTYDPAVYSYYLSGHSLGGAIDTQLKRDFPFLKDSVQFNPAFQSKDLQSSPSDIQRFYTKTDFLYKLGGYALPNVRTIEPSSYSGLSFIDAFTGHKAENFTRLFGNKTGAYNVLGR
jgi:hypothetical protein